MKTIIFTSSFFIAGLFAVYSCSSSTNAVNKESEETITNYTDTVHLTTASINIQHYVDSCHSLVSAQDDHTPIKSYTLNEADLFGVMGIPGGTRHSFYAARVYLGLDPNSNFKLYMTPVDSNNHDIILKDIDSIPYVYDLNAPCPSTCDIKSPLYKVYTPISKKGTN